MPEFYPLTANVRQKVTADTNNLRPCMGFMVDVDGVLSCRLRGDSALDTFPVLKGYVYPFDLAQVDITGSTTITEVYLFRQGAKS